MATIDADAHVVESEHTWDYMDPSERKYRTQQAGAGVLMIGTDYRHQDMSVELDALRTLHHGILRGTCDTTTRCLFRKSGTSSWRRKRHAREGGHPATLALTPWIPAYAGMTQPPRDPTDWQCIYEMDS